ncbi:MAG: hypothetical protein NTW28_20995, partial [Candidatus Solibacter sp.]|nr:hypothetical protein [Candidatus Solibacter sp.]
TELGVQGEVACSLPQPGIFLRAASALIVGVGFGLEHETARSWPRIQQIHLVNELPGPPEIFRR